MRLLLIYVIGIFGIATFMNNQIIHHKVNVKCCFCGKDLTMDSQIVGKGVHAHMACAMEAAGTASGSAFEWAKEKRNAKHDN